MSDAEKPALDLNYLQSLANAATLGPWDYDDVLCAIVAWNAPVYMDEDEREPRDVATVTYTTIDGVFIAAARESVPALIARVREAEAKRDELRAKIAAVRAELAAQPYRHEDSPCTDRCVRQVCDDVRNVLRGV